MKKLLKFLCFFAAIPVMHACLDEDASNIVSPYTFYRNKEQIRAAVNGCYRMNNDIFCLGYMIVTEGASDLGHSQYNAQVDARLDISPASPKGNQIRTWRYLWQGIRDCLSTIAGIDRSPEAADKKAPLRAEAEIMLAHYYYILTCYFGDVPYYDFWVESVEDLQTVGRIGRMPASDTRRKLIAKLQACVPGLDQVRSSDIPGNYVGAAMGWLLIAKMAAWEKDWDTVIDACSHLESIYGDLGQYPYSDVCFRYKNTPESIFEIQHAWSPNGIKYITPSSLGIASIMMPYNKTSGTAIYDGVTIEEIGPEATVYRPIQPTSYFKNEVMPDGKGDLRRPYILATGYDGVKFNGSRTWLGPKFWCPGMIGTQDGNNYKVYRYADAVLLMAEAYCEKNETDLSVRYLNQVRARAGLPAYAFESQVKLRSEIRAERGRELFGEWGRKYDLVRWDIWYEQVCAFNPYKELLDRIKPCHRYYPIPDVQCLASGGVLNNPEYDKYFTSH